MSAAASRTVRTIVAGAATVLALQAGPLAIRASAQYSASSQTAQWQDSIIKRAFRDVLRREPTTSELRRYRALMVDDHWGEADIRDDLRSRSDYRRYSPDSRDVDPDRVIRRAYEDILHREPDPEGLRRYRIEMIDNGWTEQDVRQALRKSAEHDTVRESSADRIVKRAYQDILGRDPDYNGLVQYRNRILSDGWDEQDVRQALRNSPEYRQKNAMTREKAQQVVARAYRSVLGREPDPGAEGYIQKVLRNHWTEADVARELRNSDEYRNKR